MTAKTSRITKFNGAPRKSASRRRKAPRTTHVRPQPSTATGNEIPDLVERFRESAKFWDRFVKEYCSPESDAIPTQPRDNVDLVTALAEFLPRLTGAEPQPGGSLASLVADNVRIILESRRTSRSGTIRSPRWCWFGERSSTSPARVMRLSR